MELLFVIAVLAVCLSILLAMADTVVSLWRGEHRMPPRVMPGLAPRLVPIETEDRRVQGMTFVGSERRRARQAAIEAARRAA